MPEKVEIIERTEKMLQNVSTDEVSDMDELVVVVTDEVDELLDDNLEVNEVTADEQQTLQLDEPELVIQQYEIEVEVDMVFVIDELDELDMFIDGEVEVHTTDVVEVEVTDTAELVEQDETENTEDIDDVHSYELVDTVDVETEKVDAEVVQYGEMVEMVDVDEV